MSQYRRAADRARLELGLDIWRRRGKLMIWDVVLAVLGLAALPTVVLGLAAVVGGWLGVAGIGVVFIAFGVVTVLLDRPPPQEQRSTR